MEKLTQKDLAGLSNEQLVSRMDDILSAPYWHRMGNKIMRLQVREIFNTTKVQSFTIDFQRKILYKTFGFFLQLHYSECSVSAQIFQIPEKDEPPAKQIYSAAICQWMYISSRIVFEYFMRLTYMLGTGQELRENKSVIKKYKNWLKEEGNPYTYFAVTVMRSECYDREKRTPEVHATTKLANKILLASATDIDNGMFDIINTMRNQWKFIVKIANGKDSRSLGYTINGRDIGDKEWYNIWKSGDQKIINTQIDKYFSKYIQ